jgi:signal peptide peptidase SppA
MNIPHFDQWLGVWAIREEDFQAGHQWFMGLDLHLHLQTAGAETIRQAAEMPKADIRDGVEVIGLYGTLMKQQASMSRSTGTVMTRKRLRAAGRNPDVTAVLLHAESPGGTAAGTKELADDIAALAKIKPVYGYAEDLAASACYWALSQCTKIFSNHTAIVGSIGTYGVVQDFSQAAAKEGVKVHVIRAGAMKGAFTPGTEVTTEQLAEQQKLVNELNEFFIRGVAAGRRLTPEQTRELADGRVYVGQAAVDRKLIDGVQSLDDTFNQLAAVGRKRSAKMHLEVSAEASALTPESNTQTTPATAAVVTVQAAQPASQPANAAAPAARPATYHELKAALPTADAAFLTSQLEANATVAQAQAAYMSHLAKQNTELQQQLNEKTVAAAAAPLRKPGAPSVPAAASSSASAQADEGDAVATFEAAVSEEMKLSGKPKHVAHAAVCRKQPELRTAMVAAHNAKYAQARRSA